MDKGYTFNDVMNQFANNKMLGDVAMGVRKLSYEAFKSKAREHQVRFREAELQVGFYKYPNVLRYEDARHGLIFYEGFREEIMNELQKPVPNTSTAPSGQMLTNLLRSEHIPYNIFFPMKHDLEGCKMLFNKIIGRDEVKSIEDVLVEYHPEPIEDYLDDHTAFDVYIPYTNHGGQACGIGIEVKYTEKAYPLKPGSREYSHVRDEYGNVRLSEAYQSATEKSGYYKDGVSLEELTSNKLRQIWRNHILGASMVIHGDISNFTSITLYPQENIHFSLDAMPAYRKLLRRECLNSCIPLSYENLFDWMEKCLHVPQIDEWIAYLKRRYLFLMCTI